MAELYSHSIDASDAAVARMNIKAIDAILTYRTANGQ